ncbi:alkaline phosphatase family protein [Bradyrhizobium septentrionale]|uniref:Alkaline phosphatase family protein n=1 Tax=Bradyrhizobium septentrionale TaxID=1404411 RepID=A0A973W0Q2_9BRAD|nr:alkaline phosphatase family protein [Bradyrhizobium septentrionale]UGY14111.1 alkaline phosphatase family protein [Bradyrhizobium septentrionale]UGY22666.1 alkaline phosphatase family protein [Bradyrhizobium septentrionale]
MNRIGKFAIAVLLGSSALSTAARADDDDRDHRAIEHVLLISVDGMHEVDLQHYVKGHPTSAFAKLLRHGLHYTNAHTSRPSDSFPGLLAFMTGASPKTHGVFYDDTYDQTLFPPGSNCQGKPGTEATYFEALDYDLTKLDGGGPTNSDHINPANLPLRKVGGACQPVYPHAYLKNDTTTIMEVIHEAGLRTAWSDKHPAYEIISGPSGKGLDELYAPEINSTTVLATAPQLIPAPQAGDDWTVNPVYTRYYDNLKVTAVLNWIKGLDHTGTKTVGVPAILGMNFQAVSVGQKVTADGYTDAKGTPSAQLELSLDFVDSSLGQMLDQLDKQHLTKNTLVVVGAKHGQSPIDVDQLHMLKGSTNPRLLMGHADVVDPVDLLSAGGVKVAQETADDVSLIWLADHTQTAKAVGILENDKVLLNQARIEKIYTGDELEDKFGNPAQGRTPDIIIQPLHGTIYSGSSKKVSEHGGFTDDDTHVLLVVANPGFEGAVVDEKVENKQVAPTILRALHLNPNKLTGARAEHTTALPGFDR